MANSALKLRDAVSEIIVGLINRERPKPRVCEVYRYNRLNRFAEVLLPGETEPGIQARFPKHLQPMRSKMDDGVGNATGDLVLVEGTTNNYRITQIIEGNAFGQGWYMGEMGLMGGPFMSEKNARHFSYTATLPPVGQCVQLGRWYTDATLVQHGTGFVDITISQVFFSSHHQNYRLALSQYDTAGAWKVVYPDKESGVTSGNDWILEAKSDNDSFELRVRNLAQNGTFPPSGFTYSMWITGPSDYQYDGTNFNLIINDAAPTDMLRTAQVEQDEVNHTVQQGPYFEPLKRIVHGRAEENLTGGGSVTWDDRYLLWSNNFASAIGRSRLITLGVIQIPPPTVGNPIYYHAMTGAAASINYTSSGVDMMPVAATHSVLYYEPNFGSTDGAGGKYHVVGVDLNFRVPSHWIMIAVMNQTWDYIKLGTGQIVDSGWVDLVPAAGWAHSPYTSVAKAQCRKIGKAVYFRGSLTGTLTVATTTAIANVPAGYYNGFLRNYKALGSTAGFIGWGNVDASGVFQAHFKTPYATGTAVIDTGGMTYLMD